MATRNYSITLNALTLNIAVALAACGDSTGASGTGGSAPTGGSSTGGSFSGGTGGDTGATNATGGSGGLAGGAGGTGGTFTRGCPEGGCGDRQYCDDLDNLCGEGRTVCVDAPAVGCPEIYSPVCGCDGVVYGNSCEAFQSGVDLGPANNCPSPGGAFPCGFGFCDNTLVCAIDFRGNGECFAPPANCPDPCVCFEALTASCSGTCETTRVGTTTITCTTPFPE